MKQKHFYIQQLFCSNKSTLPMEIQFLILNVAGIADCSKKGCYFWVFQPNRFYKTLIHRRRHKTQNKSM